MIKSFRSMETQAIFDGEPVLKFQNMLAWHVGAR